jgi:hypothetical protein
MVNVYMDWCSLERKLYYADGVQWLEKNIMKLQQLHNCTAAYT